MIKNIIVLGGGSAGWMTAATLCKRFPKKNITVIESPNTPTVGVGESTLGQIKNWTSFIGLDEKSFIKETGASLKLSIKFTDFYKKGTHFHYPFGGAHIKGNINETNDWWFKKILYPKTKQTDFADTMYPAMALVNQNKMTNEPIHELPFNYHTDTAYHFDATKFGIWLRDYFCKPKGVKHVVEDINDIKTNKDGIVSLNKHKADLYVDCTGFKSLLLDKTMKIPFESYSDLLPNDTAWATRMPYKNKKKELVPYTNCTALKNGWVWNIPLWARVGTGYVFSKKFTTEEKALKEFKDHLKNKTDVSKLEFRKIDMRVGIHNQLWVKNVVGIGLSAGFIEPLESNGLFSVHEFLHHLCRVLERGEVNQLDKDSFTHICKLTFKNFAEFVALHYAFTVREDSEYWRYQKNKQWSSSIINLKNDYQNGLLQSVRGKFIDFQFPLNSGLSAISAGFNWAPCDESSICYNNYSSEVKGREIWESQIKNLERRKKIWDNSVKDLPSLYDFLKDKFYESDT